MRTLRTKIRSRMQAGVRATKAKNHAWGGPPARGRGERAGRRPTDGPSDGPTDDPGGCPPLRPGGLPGGRYSLAVAGMLFESAALGV